MRIQKKGKERQKFQSYVFISKVIYTGAIKTTNEENILLLPCLMALWETPFVSVPAVKRNECWCCGDVMSAWYLPKTLLGEDIGVRDRRSKDTGVKDAAKGWRGCVLCIPAMQRFVAFLKTYLLKIQYGEYQIPSAEWNCEFQGFAEHNINNRNGSNQRANYFLTLSALVRGTRTVGSEHG